MKIGIISDTHNNVENLRAALEVLRTEGVSLLLHCGDATGVEILRELGQFRVIFLFGNGDILTGEMQQALLAMDPQNFAGLVYTGEFDGVHIAATHGHLEGQADQLVRSNRYDFVFQGHSHRHRDVLVGTTRQVNPGALGGLHAEPRSFAVLDTQSKNIKFVKITST